MSTNIQAISIEILGRSYQIKCPVEEEHALKQAAHYLEEKMNILREAGALNTEKVSIIAALNITHQYLVLLSNYEYQKMEYFKTLNDRLVDLDQKVDAVLIPGSTKQLELQPAE